MKTNLPAGYILPSTIIISIIVITTIGFLYQQSIVQQALAKNLIQQTAIYAECNSLIPILKTRLDQESTEDLMNSNKAFISIFGSGGERWQIERSAWQNQKIQFTFILVEAQSTMDPIKLTINYQRI